MHALSHYRKSILRQTYDNLMINRKIFFSNLARDVATAGVIILLLFLPALQSAGACSSYPSRSAANQRHGTDRQTDRPTAMSPNPSKGNGKGKRSIAVRKKPHRYGNSRAIWDHTVLPATRQM